MLQKIERIPFYVRLVIGVILLVGFAVVMFPATKFLMEVAYEYGHFLHDLRSWLDLGIFDDWRSSDVYMDALIVGIKTMLWLIAFVGVLAVSILLFAILVVLWFSPWILGNIGVYLLFVFITAKKNVTSTQVVFGLVALLLWIPHVFVGIIGVRYWG